MWENRKLVRIQDYLIIVEKTQEELQALQAVQVVQAVQAVQVAQEDAQDGVVVVAERVAEELTKSLVEANPVKCTENINYLTCNKKIDFLVDFI